MLRRERQWPLLLMIRPPKPSLIPPWAPWLWRAASRIMPGPPWMKNGPPTRAEATGDKEAILAGLADLDALLDAIKAKTDDLPGDPASQAAVLNAIAALNHITVGTCWPGTCQTI